MLIAEGTRLSCAAASERSRCPILQEKTFNVFAGEIHAMSDFSDRRRLFLISDKRHVYQLLFREFAGGVTKQVYIRYARHGLEAWSM